VRRGAYRVLAEKLEGKRVGRPKYADERVILK
jgi:hypothetical protein